MRQETWIGLLRLVPPELHPTMVAVTTTGIEITIQSIFRIEPEYFVVRGRLAGTTEAGRVFFLPYCQLNYLGIQQELSDARLREFYGEAPAAAAEGLETAEPRAAETVPAAAAPPEEATTPPASAESTPLPEPGRAPVRSPLPSKTRLLARLRVRGQPGSPPRPPGK
jgi:hypothetical protein